MKNGTASHCPRHECINDGQKSDGRRCDECVNDGQKSDGCRCVKVRCVVANNMESYDVTDKSKFLPT